MSKPPKTRRGSPAVPDQHQPPQLWRGLLFIVVLVLAGIGAYNWETLQTLLNLGDTLPICPECSASSGLRETLERLDPLWTAPPQKIEELTDELQIVEAAQQIPKSSSPNVAAQETACLNTLIERFDERIDMYAHSVIEQLAGFGPDVACPKIQELITLAERFQVLVKLTSKETPKCRELLDWHWQHYSCSQRPQ